MRHIKRKIWLKVPFFILLAAVILSALSLITMLLWNNLVPVLFSGPVITFWQAAGLLILSKILLGGFGPKHRRGHRHYPGEMWKRKWENKMASMTPEQREKFRKNCRGYFYDEDENTGDSKEETKQENK